MKNLTVLSIILITFAACKNEIKNSSSFKENIEIYSVKENVDGSAKGDMIYKEMTSYKLKDAPESRTYFEKDGSVKGIEKYEYDTKSIVPVGSKYYDQNDSLLSTYKFINEDNLKKKVICTEAATNEIIRLEEYEYNAQGHRTQQTIKEGNGTVNRVYKFNVDQDGNDTAMTVFDGKNTQLYQIEYVITKKDDQNRWIELWGFRNKNPEQVKYRTFQ